MREQAERLPIARLFQPIDRAREERPSRAAAERSPHLTRSIGHIADRSPYLAERSRAREETVQLLFYAFSFSNFGIFRIVLGYFRILISLIAN